MAHFLNFRHFMAKLRHQSGMVLSRWFHCGEHRGKPFGNAVARAFFRA